MSHNYNRVVLVGRLTRDPETKPVKPDKTVTSFGIAVNREWGETKEVCFIDVGFWGKTGELIAKHLKKGDPILVEGHLRFDEWTDQKTGDKKTRHVVMGERFEFVGSKEKAIGEGGSF